MSDDRLVLHELLQQFCRARPHSDKVFLFQVRRDTDGNGVAASFAKEFSIFVYRARESM